MNGPGPRRPPRRGASWVALAVLAAAIAALVSSPASADIFKCTGRDGHVTYSDAPCAGASSVRLDLKEPVEDRDPRRPVVAPNAVNRPASTAPSAVSRPTAVAPSSVTRPAVVPPNPGTPPTAVAPNAVSRPTAVAPNSVTPPAAAPNPLLLPALVAPNSLIPPAPADLVAPVDRGGGAYELSYGDRQRIAGLEQIARDASVASEARESATLEISSIRRGGLARMSYDDLRRKDDYWGDLGSSDPDRRRAAATQLADLLARYP